jgi:hypothetical protein
MTIYTVTEVGEMSGPAEKYTWTLPWIMFVIITFPFIVGYEAGKSKNQDE